MDGNGLNEAAGPALVRTFAAAPCRFFPDRRPNSLFVLLAILLVLPAATARAVEQARQPEESFRAAYRKTYTEGPASLTVTASDTRLTVAGRLVLLLRVEMPEEYTAEFPDHVPPPEGFTVRTSRLEQPELVGNDRLRQQQAVVFQPFLPGDYSLPPFTVRLTGNDGRKTELSSEAIPLQVESLLKETPEPPRLKDIRPPVAITDSRWLYWSAAAAILLLASAGGLYYRYRRNRRCLPLPEKPPSAHEIACRELEALEADNFLDQGEFKLFYTRLSDILRRYLENRFGLRAPEKTTEEFLADLARPARGAPTAAFTPTQQRLLAHFLRHCDLVKFARHQPSIEDGRELTRLCRRFLDQTRSIPGAGHGQREIDD